MTIAPNMLLNEDCIAGMTRIGRRHGSIWLLPIRRSTSATNTTSTTTGSTARHYLDWSSRWTAERGAACSSRPAHSGWPSATNMPPN